MTVAPRPRVPADLNAKPMRQPPRVTITPSNQYPWYGIPVEGERFTREQFMFAAMLGIDLETVECITVKRRATTTEEFRTPSDEATVYQMDCPVLERRRDGKIKVLTPSGDQKYVFADGWWRQAAEPKRKW